VNWETPNVWGGKGGGGKVSAAMDDSAERVERDEGGGRTVSGPGHHNDLY